MLNNPIIGGTKLPTLTNPGTAGDLLFGKQLIGQNGNVLDGTLEVPGITWKQGGSADIPLPAYANMAYGGGKFILWPGNSSAMPNVSYYSTDGITWNSTTGKPSTSAVYGGGKFVVSCGATFYYSTNGIVWTEASWPVSGDLRLAYGNGIFVAVTKNPYNMAAYSADGITWSETTLSIPGSRSPLSVAFGGEKFVVVAKNQSTGAYSTDGVTWTQMTMPSASSWSGLAYGGGIFATLTSDTSPEVARSQDGVNWTKSDSPVFADFLVYGSGKFITQGSANKTWYSKDAVTWTQAILPINGMWTCLTYGKGRFAMGGYGSAGFTTIYSG